HIVTNRALGYIASAKVGSISMLEVAFGAVYGYVLFSEPLGWSTMAGGALIIAATMGLIQGPGRSLRRGKPRSTGGRTISPGPQDALTA
ncbi:MAG: EamA family transporter, partial [Desulfosalsimonas sp.]|uniref:EamA family transporter n=1 Tax=Desulfosalsimonas sp. TaxID=3073848 RepID=UPI0039706D75